MSKRYSNACHLLLFQYELYVGLHLKCCCSLCFSHFQIPAAPGAMIDFSSAKSKNQKLDDAIAGRTGMDTNVRQLPENSMNDCKVWTTKVSPVWTVDFG